MTRFVLDTCAYSYFQRGVRAVVSLVTAATWIGLSPIVLGELRSGFGLGKRRARNEADLAAFLASPRVHSVDIDDRAAQIYADMAGALRTAGTPIPTNDVWIAAVAEREAVGIVTYDAHFHRIRGVRSCVLSL